MEISNAGENKFRFGFTSAGLHILAMVLMLSDHLWANFFLDQRWMTAVGRIAFPIFAFMIAEGFFKTSNRWKYIRRMAIFAAVSELPFNLGIEHTLFYLFHQNVMLTFTLALLALMLMEKIRTGFEAKFYKKFVNENGNGKLKADIFTLVISLALVGLITLAAFLLGMITFVDYYGFGVVAVICFYLSHPDNLDHYFGRFIKGGLNKNRVTAILTKLVSMVLQFVLLYAVLSGLGGYCYKITIFGKEIEIVEELLGLFAFIPIWLYNGKKGYSAKWFKYFNYAFYPAHLLIIYLLTLIILG